MRVISQIFSVTFSFKHNKPEFGLSLIELLVCLALSLLLAASGYQLLKSSLLIRAQLDRDYLSNYQALRIRNMVRDIIQDLNSHPLPLAPVIFKDGQIKTENHILTLSNDPLKSAHESSDAISYLELDYQNLIKVAVNEDLVLEGCSQKHLSDDLQSFIAVDLAGVGYYQGYANPISADCYRFNIIQRPTLLLAERNEQFPVFSRVLIPVLSEYLIYKDRGNLLRYVTLEGLKVKENQPLIEDAPDLKINLSKHQQLWQLNFKWTTNLFLPLKEFRYTATASITRQSVSNLMINS